MRGYLPRGRGRTETRGYKDGDNSLGEKEDGDRQICGLDLEPTSKIRRISAYI